VDELVMVNDIDLCKAMALLFRYSKIAVEPAGAASTAALLGPAREQLAGKRVGLMVCGANIDPDSFCQLVHEGELALAGGTPPPNDSLLERLRKASRVVRGN
jgi:threonine dehydratase